MRSVQLRAAGSWFLTGPLGTLIFFLLAAPAGAQGAQGALETPAAPVYDVPRLEGIAIDGKAEDWGERGFRVDILADAFGKVPPASDYSAKFRLGWNDRGLLVLVTVTDDVFFEPAVKLTELWKGDSLEFFVAAERGGSESYQVVIAPGCDPRNPNLRSHISDYRKSKGEKLTVEAARAKSDKGCVMEALLPWKNLAIEAEEGKEVAFQFYANDVDKPGQRTQLLWYPVPEANTDTHRMYRLRLAAQPSPPVQAAAFGQYDAEGKAVVNVAAVPDLKGRKVRVKEGDKKLGEEKLRLEDSAAVAQILLKPKDKGAPYGPLTLWLDDSLLASLTLPPPPPPAK